MGVSTPEHLLNLSTLVSRFGSSDVRDPVFRRFHGLLQLKAPFDDAGVGWLEDLTDWVCGRGAISARREDEGEAHARLRVLADTLDELPSFRSELASVVSGLLANASATQLFTTTGIARYGFWGELLERVVRRVLPAPPMDRRVDRLCARLFGRSGFVQAWLTVPEVTRHRLLTQLEVDGRVFGPGLREAAVLLSTRISSLGTSDEVRAAEATVSPILSSPFIELPRVVTVGGSAPIAQAIARCREALRSARAGLERKGISVELVFRLDLLASLLRRLELVTQTERPGGALALEQEVISGVATERSLGEVWRTGTQLLARRLVERAGSSGEHYTTRTRAEQRAMLAAAAGGGALTALAVSSKFFIAHAGLPPLFLALGVGLNYSVAFVVMQLFHFSLATKQPSMTAATIAGAVEESVGKASVDLEPVVDLVARASRTQAAALVGNVVMVVPACLLIDLVFHLATGSHLIDATAAAAIARNHHPTASGTFFWAAMTGVWLWAASLIAGGVENWFTLREWPEALAASRPLRRVLGPSRAAAAGEFVRAQLSGLGGNVGLGMLLGFMPMLFSLVGVPLDVRHVTFVTGQLTFAAAQGGFMALAEPSLLVALLSVPLVGLTNFAVSFTLALLVASRSRNLGSTWLLRLAGAVLRRLAKSPKQFFLAP